MDWLSEKVIIPLFVSIIAGFILAGLFKIVELKKAWAHVWTRIKAWCNRVTLYIRLSPYDRDILKAMYDSGTILLSLKRDCERSIRTELDCILKAPVACRLMVSTHYEENLRKLANNGLLRHDQPWPYRVRGSLRRDEQSYRLTDIGNRFIDKRAIGNPWIERFVPKRIRRLSGHKYKGHYVDKTGNESRLKLPNLLRGRVFAKAYYAYARTINSRLYRDSDIDIYEYPSDAREDGVECMVVIHRYLNIFDIEKGDYVFLMIPTDKSLQEQAILTSSSTNIAEASVRNQESCIHSNKPLYLDTDPELESRFDFYPVQGVVISVEVKSDGAVCTILNLGRTQVFDPDLENERNQPA